MEFREEF